MGLRIFLHLGALLLLVHAQPFAQWRDEGIPYQDSDRTYIGRVSAKQRRERLFIPAKDVANTNCVCRPHRLCHRIWQNPNASPIQVEDEELDEPEYANSFEDEELDEPAHASHMNFGDEEIDDAVPQRCYAYRRCVPHLVNAKVYLICYYTFDCY